MVLHRLALYFLLLATPVLANDTGLDPKYFPVDEAMRVRVDFWKRVYTEISSREGFIHDSDNLGIIYTTVRHTSSSRRARSRQVRQVKREIRNHLRSIYRKKKRGLTEAEAEILRAAKNPSLSELRSLTRNIRYQRGLRDMYTKGLERSYAYLDRIKKIFVAEGIPVDLSYLPHVESSFNYKAYSKVGAAGIWQFMRSTGRQFNLGISYTVDERRDPIKAGRAAARLLSSNYRKLESWPLALTAYNHGAASMARAIRRVKTRDISTIIEKYRNRRFGFASKNFYATFVATVEISKQSDKYFPGHKKAEPMAYSEIALGKPLTMRQISQELGLSVSTLKDYNLAVRPIAFRSNLYLPADYRLRIPATTPAKLASYEKQITELKGGENLRVGGTHRVARGENLYEIARIYRTSMHELVALNSISRPSRIYPGMKIKIPAGKGSVLAKKFKTKPKTKRPVLVAAREERQAEPSPTPTEDSETEAVSSALEDMSEEPGEDSEEEEKEALAAGAEENPALYENVGPFPEGYTQAARELVSVDAYDLEMKEKSRGRYRIVVEPEETLGHFADWAGTSAGQIRRVNRLRYGTPIRVGQNLTVPVSESKVADFSTKRMEYHLAMQEDFYSAYRVAKTKPYRVRRGDTVDGIVRRYEIPKWLLRKVQPGPLQLIAGQTIQVPVVEPISPSDDADADASE